MDFLIPAIYWPTWLLTAVLVARHLAAEGRRRPKFIDACVGCAAAILWPIAIVPVTVLWLARRESPSERRERVARELRSER